ncbi:hypothetical protein BH10PSE9_BH10PSE9_07110 [soil metagenome]
MKSRFATLAGLGLLLAIAGAARAAAPAYCALYAREYANQFTAAAGQPAGAERRIQDEAYYKCLNMDQEPELPSTSAYSGTDLDATAKGGPLEDLPTNSVAATEAQGDADMDETTPLTPSPAKPKVNTPPKRKYYGSGLAAWSPEWKSWCQAHFPNSFDEKTGTILPSNGGGKRVFCR